MSTPTPHLDTGYDPDCARPRRIAADISCPRCLPRRALENRKGEFQIDSMNSVEDTKGNNGERGELMITNLRMVWNSSRSRKTNLSKPSLAMSRCACGSLLGACAAEPLTLSLRRRFSQASATTASSA